MDEIVIKAEGLTKSYGGRRVVDNVNMSVRRGDIYGFIGANGAGKTTFLRMVMGLVRPDFGTLELFGERSAASLVKSRAKIGCIIETPSLILSMNAYDCLYTQKLTTGSGADIGGLLATVGLSGVGSKRIKDFSLGMKQRLAIAQALICEPEILILDEPTNGMDPAGIVETRNFLKNLAENGITIVMSSHILSELEQLATRYGIIANGKLIEEFTAAEFKKKQGRSVTIQVDDAAKAHRLLMNAFTPNQFRSFGGGRLLIRDEADFKEVNKLLVSGGVGVEILSKDTGDLEKYFIETVGGK